MPKMSVSVPHSLGGAEAKARLEKLAGKVTAKYQDQAKDVEQSWDGDTLNFSFRTMGMNFNGAFEVQEDAINAGGEIPFAAMIFKGKIEKGLREELEKLLA